MREESIKDSKFGISELSSAHCEPENNLRLEISSCHIWSPLPLMEKGQKQTWLIFPPLHLSLKKLHSTLLLQENNKTISPLPSPVDRNERYSENRLLKERTSCFKTYRVTFFPKSTCPDLILFPGRGLIAIPPGWSKDRLASTQALQKVLLILYTAAQQERAVSLQDLGGYIYISLKGSHLEQQGTWHTPPPADCLPVENLFGPAW